MKKFLVSLSIIMLLPNFGWPSCSQYCYEQFTECYSNAASFLESAYWHCKGYEGYTDEDCIAFAQMVVDIEIDWCWNEALSCDSRCGYANDFSNQNIN